MKKHGTGGGRTVTGLYFEKRVDVVTLLRKVSNYTVIRNPNKIGFDIYYKNDFVARSFKQGEFYKFLEEQKIDWRTMVSKRWMPDNALIVIIRDTLFIVEVKYQQVAGSVDEKLQTCDFKRKFYQNLVRPLGLKVDYVYVLNDWFKQPQYKDTLEYITNMNCHYLFNELPLAWLGLPTDEPSSKMANSAKQAKKIAL